MRVRKEVMKAYSRKVRNNDGFIIYMTVPPRNYGNSAWKLAKSRHGKYERYFINHQSDMDDSDIVQGWDLKDCLGLHPTSVSIIALELNRAEINIRNFGNSYNSRGGCAGYVHSKMKSEVILWFFGQNCIKSRIHGESRYEPQERSYEGIKWKSRIYRCLYNIYDKPKGPSPGRALNDGKDPSVLSNRKNK